MDADGRQLESDPDGSHEREWDALAASHPRIFDGQNKPRYVPDAAAVAASAYVDSYHIDTQQGLNHFVAIIRARMLSEAAA